MEVKLYGTFRHDTGKKSISIDQCKNLKEVIRKLELETTIPVKDWKRGVIYVDGEPITNLKMFKTAVSSESEITILSPVSGG